MHVPSTKDLLAQVPVDKLVDTQAWRQRAHSMGGTLVVGLERLSDGSAEPPDTPRTSLDSPGAITEFASGTLDLEVRRVWQAHSEPLLWPAVHCCLQRHSSGHLPKGLPIEPSSVAFISRMQPRSSSHPALFRKGLWGIPLIGSPQPPAVRRASAQT